MRNQSPFRKPDEIKSRDTKLPVSARVPLECKGALEIAATKSGLSLSELIAGILEDYTRWIANK